MLRKIMHSLEPFSFFPRAYERRVLPIVGVCYTSSHLHISSSHVHIYTFHLHIFTYHLRLFTSSHLHISTYHLHIFTSNYTSCPHISSSHLHVYTYHLHIFTSSLSLPLSLFLPLSLPPSLSLSLSLSLSPLCQGLSPSFVSYLLRPRAVPTRRHKMATLSHEMRFDRQKLK